MADLSELYRQIAFYEGGGGKVDEGKQLLDTAVQGVNTYNKIAKDFLERKKLTQETAALEAANKPAYTGGYGDSPYATTQRSTDMFKKPLSSDDMLGGTTTGEYMDPRSGKTLSDPTTTVPLEQGVSGAREQYKNTPIREIPSRMEEFKSMYEDARRGSVPIKQAVETATANLYPTRKSLMESQEERNRRLPITKPNITTPVISGGIATREFVKTLNPDLGDNEDMPYGEFLKRAGQLQAQMTAGQQKPISSEQVDKITQIRTAITGLSDIKDQYFKLLGEGRSPIDPIEGRWTTFKSRLGIMGDADISKFQTDLVAQLNTYLNALSGAAITEQEAVRLKARLPQIGTTNEQFLGQADSFDSELKRALGSRVSTLKDAGFRTGELDRFIPKSQKPKTQTPSSNLRTATLEDF